MASSFKMVWGGDQAFVLVAMLHELLSYIFRSARTSCRDFDFSTRPPAAAYIDNFFWTYGLTDYQIEGIPCGPL